MLCGMHLEFASELFRWSARREDVYLLEIPEDLSAMIREIPRPTRGFGSVRVAAQIGDVVWATSIFPDAQRGTYVLPVKRAVRDAAVITDGDTVHVRIDVQGS